MPDVKLSLFTEVQCPSGVTPEQRLAHLVEQAERADALGFHGLWISEIHFQPEFSLLSAPYVVLGAIAARTRRLRLGVAVNVLPVHHPVHVAEQAATLDVLSHGRVDFAVGRGHVHSRVYEGFGVDRAQSRVLQTEALQVIQAAWTQDVLQFHGTYFTVPEIVVNPKPLQQPHLPVHLAANSLDGVEEAARLGVHLFLPAHLLPRADLLRLVDAYWTGLARHGHDPATRELGLLLPIHVAPAAEQAQAEAGAGFLDYYRVIRQIQDDYLAWPGRQGAEGPLPAARQPMTLERLCAEAAILSDPATAVVRLRELIAQTRATQILCWINMGSVSHELVLGSLERFARDVMPHLASG